MNFTHHSEQSPWRRSERRGFALIVTITMMVLLSVLGVGLLSLSGVALRASSGSENRAIAQANARMALSLAIGELQRLSGPDTRITAAGGILGEDANHPQLTGVWQSRDITGEDLPTAADFSVAAKEEQFLGWLASAADDGEMLRAMSFGKAGVFPGPRLARMMSAVPGAADEVSVGIMPVADGSRRSGFGWIAFDEGVKARLGSSPEANSGNEIGSRSMSLGSGNRAAIEKMNGLGSIESDQLISGGPLGKVLASTITRNSFDLFAEAAGVADEQVGSLLRHDLTVDSEGLLVDVARGGFKQDLSAMFGEESLPADYQGQGVYSSVLQLSDPSDPKWESFQGLARMYRDAAPGTRLGGIVDQDGVPTVLAQAPAGWTAGTVRNGVATPILDPPPGLVLLPTIAKVQMVFSLLARDVYHYPARGAPPGAEARERSAELHGPWGGNFAGTRYDYLLHMLYTPIVTLHNPYNVSLECRNLSVDFVNVPMAVQLFRNNVAQMNGLVPVTRMFAPTENGGQSKRFTMRLREKRANGSPGELVVRLQPGEVKVFSPYIPPTLNWAGEAGTQQYFFDWRNENEGSGRGGDHVDTSTMDGVPGWTGESIGYDLDWFAPSSFRVSSSETENGRSLDRGGCIALRADDQIHIEFAPLSDPAASKNKFTVEMKMNGVRNDATIVEFDYVRPDGLQSTLLGRNGRLRYPKDGTIRAIDMWDHSQTRLRDYERPKPFALFSAYGKTTMAMRDGTPEDGRNASMPYAFHSTVGPVSAQRITPESQGYSSHEINFEQLDGTTADEVQISGEDRGNFITGHTSFTGNKFGILYDIPIAPLQSLPSLNAANPAGGGYLPRFAQPIGNSWAHPLLPTDSVSYPDGALKRLDHSFLLNAALYDHFYFSGIADCTGPFLSGRGRKQVADEFFEGAGMSHDARFVPWLAGKSASDASEIAIDENDGFRKIASLQMLRGAFNVNSTSEEAWKAMLGALDPRNAPSFELDAANPDAQISTLPPGDKDGSIFSRFRLPGSEPSQRSDSPEQAYWLGGVEITSAQLEILAEEVVREVRARGPFLNMSDFVNRQIGSASELTQKGALQAAIDRSGINDDAPSTAGYEISADRLGGSSYPNAAAMTGFSGRGAPGSLIQQDLLAVLGNAASVRSDTFRVRAYGEALSPSGEIVATARCEAIVQRIPEFVDPADKADAPIDAVNPINQRFGRRFIIKSFRWLDDNEI